MYSRENTSPNYIEFSKKSNKNWEVCLIPKTQQGENLFAQCFQLLKLIIWNNFKYPNKSILVKNKEKHYRQSGILLFTILKILDSYLNMKPNLAKNQLWIRSSTSVLKYMKQQFTTWEGFVSESRSTAWTSHPTFRFDSSLQKRMKQWNKSPMSTILWTNSKNCPKFWETLCLLIIVISVMLCYVL